MTILTPTPMPTTKTLLQQLASDFEALEQANREERDAWSHAAAELGVAPYGGAYTMDAVRKAISNLKFERDHFIRIFHGYDRSEPVRVWLLSGPMGGHFEWGAEADIRAKYEDDPDCAIVGYVEVRRLAYVEEQAAAKISKLTTAIREATQGHASECACGLCVALRDPA